MATGLGFHDEGLGFALLSALVVGQEVWIFVGKGPGDREELVLSWELFSEVH